MTLAILANSLANSMTDEELAEFSQLVSFALMDRRLNKMPEGLDFVEFDSEPTQPHLRALP